MTGSSRALARGRVLELSRRSHQTSTCLRTSPRRSSLAVAAARGAADARENTATRLPHDLVHLLVGTATEPIRPPLAISFPRRTPRRSLAEIRASGWRPLPVFTRFVYSRAARVARPSLECEGHLHDVEVYQPRADCAAEAPHGVVITHAPAQPVRCGVSFQILQTGTTNRISAERPGVGHFRTSQGRVGPQPHHRCQRRCKSCLMRVQECRGAGAQVFAPSLQRP